MLNKNDRSAITKKIGRAVDGLVKELYSERHQGFSDVQEPDISSRLCERLEDRLNNQTAGSYTIRVTAHSLPDRGPGSMEKALGADIFLSVSLDGKPGFDKGLLIQAKYDRSISKADLKESRDKMKRVVDDKGAYFMIYTPNGAKIISADQIDRLSGNSIEGAYKRTFEGFLGRILDCYAGSKEWGVPGKKDRRRRGAEKLREAKARTLLDISLEK